nr:2878_t:CDS:1 [Entrophospora candida]
MKQTITTINHFTFYIIFLIFIMAVNSIPAIERMENSNNSGSLKRRGLCSGDSESICSGDSFYLVELDCNTKFVKSQKSCPDGTTCVFNGKTAKCS